jgi:hypothetical protein
MRGHGEKLSRKKEQAIAALLSEPTVALAAAKIGVDQSTLQAWLKRPAFAASYRKARRQIVESAVIRLQRLCGKAVKTLGEAMGGDHTPSRVRAALGVIDRAIKAVEVFDLEERLAELERRQAERGHEK